ncbi:Acg family FMN-binding oxidoreductase [Smaragdicoccus niigatensis]|uniref:Acg family FMN-binding oxidoreductase n=1 Tax=Smaragdicoccus niigatensis TaxID=359359 RepID=UPI000372635B|nr:hypothetical protein [Smaragdicoccus niigatensis]
MTLTLPGADTITTAVELASRAPSLHNTQPWRWHYDRAGLKLYADTQRLLQDTDPSGRELILSCGAALDHLRVAMAGMGFKSVVERFPNPNDPQFLALIEFTRSVFVTDSERARVDAMARRYSDRLPLRAPRGWAEFEQLLRPTLGPDVELTVVPDELRSSLERASTLVEGLRRYDSRYHSELDWWTGQAFGSVGIPRENLASAEESERVAVGRQFPHQGNVDRRTEVTEDRSTVVILSTDTDTRRDFLRCGEALSTLLLEATMAGFASCTLTHLIELPGTRGVVQQMVPANLHPQVLVRIGAASGTEVPAPTPRRDVHKILEIGI